MKKGIGQKCEIVIGSILLTIVKLIDKWPLYLQVNRLSAWIYKKRKQKVCVAEEERIKYAVDIMRSVVVWCPLDTACLQRSMVALLVCSWHGIDARAVLGYYHMPLSMHVWLEDCEGNTIYNSPRPAGLIRKMAANPFIGKGAMVTRGDV